MFDTLEDWLSLPEAGNTDSTGRYILEDEKEQSPHLAHTTAGWAREFGTTDGAIEQLIKRRQLHVNSVLGRSGIRIVRLYTKSLIADILAKKKPWGTKRKKKKKRITVG